MSDEVSRGTKRKRRRHTDVHYGYIPAPDYLPGFPQTFPVKPIGGRTRWEDKKGHIYTWDKRHGTVEVFDAQGKHLGEFDPESGKEIKGAVLGRVVEK